jgi:hypothetical protein
VNCFQVSLAVTLGPLLLACARASDRQIDSTSSTVSDSAKPVRSRAQLVAACRDTAARDYPVVRWAQDTSLNADLNYDGSPELVVWGTEGDSIFVVSIIECSGSRPGRVWGVPLRALAVFGTTELDVVLEDPAPGDGYYRETCMGAETTAECRHLTKLNKDLEAAYLRGGRGLSIGVEDQDHVHVYWDTDARRFASWRP